MERMLAHYVRRGILDLQAVWENRVTSVKIAPGSTKLSNSRHKAGLGDIPGGSASVVPAGV